MFFLVFFFFGFWEGGDMGIVMAHLTLTEGILQQVQAWSRCFIPLGEVTYLIPTLLSAHAEMCISRILPELKTWSWKSQPQVNYHPTNIADHTVEVYNHTLCHLSQPLQAQVWGDLFALLVNVVINRAILSKLWIRNSNKVKMGIQDTSHTVNNLWVK